MTNAGPPSEESIRSDDPRWAAALAVLDRINVSASEPQVVRSGLALLVRQDGVLVRSRLRAQEPVAAREVELGRVLAEAGVAVVPLVAGRGQPWVEGRCVVTAWEWCEVVGSATPADIGHLARDLRERTSGSYAFDVSRIDPLTAIRNAVAQVPIGDPGGDFVRLRAQELTAPWAQVADTDPAGTAIVHGDLHADNVLLGVDGPVLTDLELAGSGPCSYDTAPAVVGVHRYGADAATLDGFIEAQELDPRPWPGFTTCLGVYELWVTAWAVGVAHARRAAGDDSAPVIAEADTRVRCLRDGSDEPWRLL